MSEKNYFDRSNYLMINLVALRKIYVQPRPDCLPISPWKGDSSTTIVNIMRVLYINCFIVVFSHPNKRVNIKKQDCNLSFGS